MEKQEEAPILEEDERYGKGRQPVTGITEFDHLPSTTIVEAESPNIHSLKSKEEPVIGSRRLSSSSLAGKQRSLSLSHKSDGSAVIPLSSSSVATRNGSVNSSINSNNEGHVLSSRISSGNIAVTTASSTAVNSTSIGRQRVYKTLFTNKSKTSKKAASASGNAINWVTREIAALDFLLNVPMQAEQSIVHEGWLRQQGYTSAELKNLGTSFHKHRTPTNSCRNGTSDAASERTGDDEHIAVSVNKNNEDKADEETKMEIRELPIFHPSGRWWDKWIPTARHGHLKNITTTKRLESGDIEMGGELELPENKITVAATKAGALVPYSASMQPTFAANALSQVPGRRLMGDEAVHVQIPLTVDTLTTRQRSIARQAAIREWELRMAHGIGQGPSATPPPRSRYPTGTKQIIVPQHQKSHGSMLDGRMFFSAAGGYPMGVYSIKRYEPKKEEAIRRRQKLEALGGGGTQFFSMPARDWRGISYRPLLILPEKQLRKLTQQVNLAQGFNIDGHGSKKVQKLSIFDRFARGDSNASASTNNANGTQKLKKEKGDANNNAGGGDQDNDNDNDDDSSVSSFDSQYDNDDYKPGLLDDPEMVQGRHRNVMIGDRDTGCIVSSIIQFVKPELLKADLNQQFRDRFDGWEPPKSQRQYIGAGVVDGVYTLMEPSNDNSNNNNGNTTNNGNDTSGTLSMKTGGSETSITATFSTPMRKRKGSVTSIMSSGSNSNGSSNATGNKGNSSNAANSNGNDDGKNSKNAGGEKETIRMPPSLTLSKIRSIKMQALSCAVKAKLELGTVALAFVYFERLCLACRVDKTNRRLSFAACLLLAIKINENHVALLTQREGDTKSNNNANNGSGNAGGGGTSSATKKGTGAGAGAGMSSSNKKGGGVTGGISSTNKKSGGGIGTGISSSSKKGGGGGTGISSAIKKKAAVNKIQSLIRPTKKSSSMFASVLEFFTQDWSLSLQHIFAAEWGVFAALQFRLHATPSQVAFHFRRLLKSMSWDARGYLGSEMYAYWQEALSVEEYHLAQRASRENRKEERRNEQRLIQMQRELDEARDQQKSLNKSGGKDSSDRNSLSVARSEVKKTKTWVANTRSKKRGSSTGAESRINSNGVGVMNTTRLGGMNRKLSSGNLLGSPQRAVIPGPRLTGLNKLLFGKRVMSSDRLLANSQTTEQKQIGTEKSGGTIGEDIHSISSSDHNLHSSKDSVVKSSLTLSPSMPMIAGSFRVPEEEYGVFLDLNLSSSVDGKVEAEAEAGQGNDGMSEADSDEGIMV